MTLTDKTQGARFQPLAFHVPWDALCSDNDKYMSRRFVLTPKYRQSKELAGLFAMQAAKKARWKRAEGPLKLAVVVTPPDRRHRDLNFSKSLKDGITASEAVWWDDQQVWDERWAWQLGLPTSENARVLIDKDRAGAVITIEEI